MKWFAKSASNTIINGVIITLAVGFMIFSVFPPAHEYKIIHPDELEGCKLYIRTADCHDENEVRTVTDAEVISNVISWATQAHAQQYVLLGCGPLEIPGRLASIFDNEELQVKYTIVLLEYGPIPEDFDANNLPHTVPISIDLYPDENGEGYSDNIELYLGEMEPEPYEKLINLAITYRGGEIISYQ